MHNIHTCIHSYFDLNQIWKVLLRIRNLYPDLCTPFYVEKDQQYHQQCLHLRRPNYGVICPFWSVLESYQSSVLTLCFSSTIKSLYIFSSCSSSSIVTWLHSVDDLFLRHISQTSSILDFLSFWIFVESYCVHLWKAPLLHALSRLETSVAKSTLGPPKLLEYFSICLFW